MPIYDAPGGNEVRSPNPAVVIVDKDGVPASLGGGSGGSGPTAAEIGEAVNGTPITGQTLEAGGASGTGWLSSLRKAITDRIPASLGAKTGANSLSVVPASDSTFKSIGVGAVLRQSVTRPNNTTAYGANTVWGGIFTLATGYAPGTVLIPTDIEIILSTVANTATMRVYLLNSPLTTPITDNGTFSPPLSDANTKFSTVQGIPMGAMSAVGANLYSSASVVGQQQQVTVDASGNIYAYVITSAHTPVASSVMTLKIGVVV
jgi:hypothetical protein